jgi:hypothetical protein
MCRGADVEACRGAASVVKVGAGTRAGAATQAIWVTVQQRTQPATGSSDFGAGGCGIRRHLRRGGTLSLRLAIWGRGWTNRRIEELDGLRRDEGVDSRRCEELGGHQILAG